MGEHTGIHWTHHTFNPWIGCMKVSPGCANCYAETLATNRMGLDVWGPAATTHRKMMSENYWKEPLKWNRKAEAEGVRRRVFCASMADVFEDHPDLNEPRARLWNLIEATPALDWLLLTKRPQNIELMLPDNWWPWSGPENIWLGTSIESQDYEFRAQCLRRINTAVHFLSIEPLLGPINLRWELASEDIEWVIVGGESGPGCRPMNLDWARKIRDDCREYGVPLFFKQVGGTRKIDGVAGGELLDGERIQMFPGEE